MAFLSTPTLMRLVRKKSAPVHKEGDNNAEHNHNNSTQSMLLSPKFKYRYPEYEIAAKTAAIIEFVIPLTSIPTSLLSTPEKQPKRRCNSAKTASRGGGHVDVEQDTHCQKQFSLISPFSSKVLLLNFKEIQCIQQMWKSIGDKNDFAKNIFERMFDAKPSLKSLFGVEEAEKSEQQATGCCYQEHQHQTETEQHLNAACPKMANSSTYDGAQLRMHYVAFVRFWDSLIETLPKQPERFLTLVRANGVRHSTIRDMSFDAANWLLMKTTILKTVLLASPNTDGPMLPAWHKMLTFVFSEMKEAYLSSIIKNNSP